MQEKIDGASTDRKLQEPASLTEDLRVAIESMIESHENGDLDGWEVQLVKRRLQEAISASVQGPVAIVISTPQANKGLPDVISVKMLKAQPVGTKFYTATSATQPAPVPPVAWVDAETISNLPAVDEAIRTLLDDQTADNATAVVQAILDAAQQLNLIPSHSTGLKPEQEREAFEQHWYDFYHCGSISARRDGTYIHPAVQKAWEAWQARAAHSTTEKGGSA